MSALTNIEKAVTTYLTPALTALIEIQHLTGTGGLPAEEVLAGIQSVLKNFSASLGADVTPQSILADMANADQSVAADNAAADAAAAAKFPTGG